MKKKMLSVILIGCMLFGSVQGVFADEAEPADAEEIAEAEEESAYSDAEDTIGIMAFEETEEFIATENTETPDQPAAGSEEAFEAEPESEMPAVDELGTEDVSETEEAEEAEQEEDLEQASAPTVTYHTHVQTYGWEKAWKKDGEMSGTQGQAKRLEGIEIKAEGDASLGIRYRTHIQTYGWENSWKENGQMSGTSGQAKRLEAIQIELTGADASKYDVWYCVHAQHFGWLNWAKNGADAGTAGYSYRLEGIKIRILPKGSSAPAKEGSSQAAFYSKSDGPSVNWAMSGVAYNTHVQTYGWQDYAYNGTMAGTQGQSKRLEGIHISLLNPQYSGGIEYRTHVQTYGWENTWRANGQMSGTSGQSKRLEAIQIRLTGEMANRYDVYYRVHAQHFGWMGWAKNGASAGTAGYSYRLEGIQIVLVNKGGAAPSTSLGGNKQAVSACFSDKSNQGTNPASGSTTDQAKLESDLFGKISGSFARIVDKSDNYFNATVSKDGKIKGNFYYEGIGSQDGKIFTTYNVCDFNAKLANVSKIDEYTYSVKVINYQLTHKAGTSSGKYTYFDVKNNFYNNTNYEFFVYLPGKSVSSLPPEMAIHYEAFYTSERNVKAPSQLKEVWIVDSGILKGKTPYIFYKKS